MISPDQVKNAGLEFSYTEGKNTKFRTFGLVFERRPFANGFTHAFGIMGHSGYYNQNENKVYSQVKPGLSLRLGWTPFANDFSKTFKPYIGINSDFYLLNGINKLETSRSLQLGLSIKF